MGMAYWAVKLNKDTFVDRSGQTALVDGQGEPIGVDVLEHALGLADVRRLPAEAIHRIEKVEFAFGEQGVRSLVVTSAAIDPDSRHGWSIQLVSGAARLEFSPRNTVTYISGDADEAPVVVFDPAAAAAAAEAEEAGRKRQAYRSGGTGGNPAVGAKGGDSTTQIVGFFGVYCSPTCGAVAATEEPDPCETIDNGG